MCAYKKPRRSLSGALCVFDAVRIESARRRPVGLARHGAFGARVADGLRDPRTAIGDPGDDAGAVQGAFVLGPADLQRHAVALGVLARVVVAHGARERARSRARRGAVGTVVGRVGARQRSGASADAEEAPQAVFRRAAGDRLDLVRELRIQLVPTDLVEFHHLVDFGLGPARGPGALHARQALVPDDHEGARTGGAVGGDRARGAAGREAGEQGSEGEPPRRRLKRDHWGISLELCSIQDGKNKS